MHGANYRDGKGQVFTRKEYIKGKPQIKIAKFQGGKKAIYQYCVQLLLNEKIQIRHMAIEACRLSANKTLEKTAGEQGYYSRLRIYPHNLLRENKQIATAGADRVSEGMRRSWGKATSLGARVRQGQCIMEIYVDAPHLEAAKKSLKSACVKLPGTPKIKIIEHGKLSP
ncbi:MAG TPA: 50S ribosomal protein L16 [Nitrosopumilaceae archaeon]|nr:50S ribosomal protein L16 [Nitrosopumilaceae archaeon]